MITILRLILLLKDRQMYPKSLKIDKNTDFDYLSFGSNVQSRKKVDP